MTQEEKAKAYDKAIEKIKYVMEHGVSPVLNKEDLQDIFPELAESEDEKIRQKFIKLVKMSSEVGGFALHKWEADEMIAWLEKQAEKDKLIQELGKYKVKYTQEVLEKHINSMSNKDDERLRKTTISFLKDFVEQGYENAVECIDWLEKQGEKQQGKSALKAIKEEKVDNANYVSVTKSFSIDDWVVANGTHYRAKIKAFIENDDVVEFEDGTFETTENLIKDYHLWTIEDAKSGDVLIDVYGNIGIYEECDDFDWMSYCSLGHNGSFQYFKVEHENEKTHPATKEQRDFLFQKMKESSYEWDAEKKELDKIEKQGEQKKSYDVCDSSMMDNKKSPYGEKRDFGYFEEKPADKVEPKFHDGDWVVISTTKGDRVVQIASVEYFTKNGHPSYITTEGRWFGNGTKARLLTDKDVEIATIPESKAIINNW